MNDDDDDDSYLGAYVVRHNPYVDPLFSRMIAAAIFGDFRHVPEEKEPEPATEPVNQSEIVTFDLVPLTDEELVKARAEGRIALPTD